MLFDLPSDDTLYQALLDRDARFDGQAYVAVTSTGIFCRLTCPARKPHRENCQFYQTVPACIEAGFRACKRCHPLGTAADNEPAVKALLAALDACPDYRWREADLTRLGFDPSTVRRAFKRNFGMTFLEMARQRRLAAGFTTLQSGKVITAQHDSGFESASAFRRAFAKLMGQAPAAFQQDAMLRAGHISTPLGAMIAVCDKNMLHLLEFADRKALPKELQKLRIQCKGNIGFGRFDLTDQVEAGLGRYFDGVSGQFDIPLALHGTPFTQEVWRALQTIPAGQTRSYHQIAETIGKPDATRAVARANGANQIALIIPCHRVIGADGSLTGYGGGLWRKQRLIDIERQYLKGH